MKTAPAGSLASMPQRSMNRAPLTWPPSPVPSEVGTLPMTVVMVMLDRVIMRTRVPVNSEMKRREPV